MPGKHFVVKVICSIPLGASLTKLSSKTILSVFNIYIQYMGQFSVNSELLIFRSTIRFSTNE